MKTLALLTLIFSTFLTSAFTAEAVASPHLDLEMRGAEYAPLLAKHSRLYSTDSDELQLAPVLAMGQRNMDFLKSLNSQRAPNEQISLTSAATTTGIPIDHPKLYNLASVYKTYEDLLLAMPVALKAIIASDTTFPSQLPLPQDEYILWGRRVDNAYQMAARWLLMKPYLSELASRSPEDIRGYYFLTRETNLEQELSRWKQLDPAKKAPMTAWLRNLCNNSVALANCTLELNTLLTNEGDLVGFYNKYLPAAKKLYDSYFQIDWQRQDIIFTAANADVLHIPFVNPQNDPVLHYLRDNIEDEWKWQNWHLRMDFQSGDPKTMAHIQWQTGVTPHVSGGNTIVMDANQPTTEYDSQWTIRHEFGHILGFPDCYVEFYDTDQAAIVSYQLDVTNLMCSRQGHLQQRHYDELKRVYLK